MDLTKPILLIDASYFVFYRYYAVKGWYKRAHEVDLDVERMTEDDVFMEKYDSTFEKVVCDLAKKYKTPGSNIVFAKDCSRENIWRTPLFPAYKASRDDKAASFNGDIFKHTYASVIPRLREQYGVNEVHHENLEADDIIALFVKFLRDTKDLTKARIIIITNDNDYVQLYSFANIDIVNLQNKALADRIDNVADYLEYKIIIGDKSDNIGPIAKKIGDKTAKKMIADKEYYAKVLAGTGVRDQYERNKTLIDFNCIPVEFKDTMFRIFQNVITGKNI